MDDNMYLIVIISTVVFLLLAVFIVSFLWLFQRRQLQNLRETVALKTTYEQEILRAQLEIQNQTLQQVGRDLHDNIGQLMALTKLHLNALAEEPNPELATTRLTDVTAVVDLAVREIRALTKSLDKEFIEQFGLINSLQHELDRLEQTGQFTTEFTLIGRPYPLGFQREIVLFRVLQEVLNNIIKHANATKITVSGTFTAAYFELTISDNGLGFDLAETRTRELGTSGAGLRSIQRRTELIGGTCRMDTAPGQGTKTTLNVPSSSNLYDLK